MNESKNVRKNVSMMLTGMVIGAALTGGSIAVAAGITAEPTWQPIFVDGQQVEMQAYNIAGHNYVKLRDMGKQVVSMFIGTPESKSTPGIHTRGLPLPHPVSASAATRAAPSAPETAAA